MRSVLELLAYCENLKLMPALRLAGDGGPPLRRPSLLYDLDLSAAGATQVQRHAPTLLEFVPTAFDADQGRLLRQAERAKPLVSFRFVIHYDRNFTQLLRHTK